MAGEDCFAGNAQQAAECCSADHERHAPPREIAHALSGARRLDAMPPIKATSGRMCSSVRPYTPKHPTSAAVMAGAAALTVDGLDRTAKRTSSTSSGIVAGAPI